MEITILQYIKADAKKVPKTLKYKLEHNLLTLEDQEEACKDPEYAYRFAFNAPEADIRKCEEVACKNYYWAYAFAVDVPGADIRRCEEAACKDPETAYLFAKDVPEADINKCQEAACKAPCSGNPTSKLVCPIRVFTERRSQNMFKAKFKNYNSRKQKKSERKTHNWSKLQQNIFANVENGNGNSLIVAAPGSGKSATILESLWHVPPEFRGSESRTLSIAFNSSIAAHLNTYSPPGVDSMTFHRLGYQTVRKNWGIYGIGAWGSVDKDDEIAESLAVNAVGAEDNKIRLRKNLAMAVKLSKNTLATSIEEINETILNFSIDLCGLSPDSFSEIVFDMIDATRDKPLILNGQSVISFDDMIWLPYINGWQSTKYDYIFVDEGQDMSLARFDLVKSAMSPNARLFVFGDKMQCIYSFSGAAPEIIDGLETKSTRLPLTISYRLPKTVTKLAQKLNPEITHADNAIDGMIYNLTKDDIYSDITPGSAILSRTNYPLVNMAFALISRGIKANILGKDIGNRFLWRIACWQPSSVEDLRTSINLWYDEVCEYLISKNKPTERIEDEAKSILAFTKGASTVKEVQDRIAAFFSDEKANIQLSTAHKAKGLEWDRVYLLDKTFKPEKGDEEERIYYVAITRPKKRLVFVHEGSK